MNLLPRSYKEMALFYTGRGDKGQSFVGKKKVPKDSLLIEALGDLDELNSLLGVVKSTFRDKLLEKKLTAAQENLFIVQAEIGSLLYPKFKSPKIKKAKIQEMERDISAIEKKIKPERGFVIPGINPTAAWLDYARSIARRAERSANKLRKKHRVSPEALAYLNRLSSYLYALARFEAAQAGAREKHPKYQ